MTADISRPTTPTSYARLLLDSLDLPQVQPSVDLRAPELLWRQSGAMWLSGHANEAARFCPAPLAACAQGAWLALSALAPQSIDAKFDAFRLLGERAAIARLTRQGLRSAGGACRLWHTADGVLALNLARSDDTDLLPAWVEQPVADLESLTNILSQCKTAELLQRARLLGLAVAPMVRPQGRQPWFRATRHATARRRSDTPIVIDLSALWAGPLCAQLLSQCGARVIKVESESRPDGARAGPIDFYDLLNGGKESVALDLRSSVGREQLRALLQCADIVVEASRPRALEQMGICAADLIAANPGLVWLSITGYGRSMPMGDWIAYGDDAGVAAGLSWLMGGDRGDPVFCGDAIADPLTGLHAALLAYAAWSNGGGLLLDVSLHAVAAHCAAADGGSESEVAAEIEVSAPVARAVAARAAALGADTSRVLREFL